MENRRKLVRLEVKDFLEIRPLDEKIDRYKGKTKDITLMGICFCSSIAWRRGQMVFIDYFLPEELDSVKLRVEVVWTEFIGDSEGYFCGGKIIDVECDKQEKFSSYYFQKLKERPI